METRRAAEVSGQRISGVPVEEEAPRQEVRRPALAERAAPIRGVAGASTERVFHQRSRTIAGDGSLIAEFGRKHGAFGEELPGFDRWLARAHGVPTADSPEAKAKLIELYQREREAIEVALAGELPKDQKKLLEGFDLAFKAGLRQLERSVDGDTVSVSTAVRTAKEALYSMMAEAVHAAAGERYSLINVLGIARRFVAQDTYRLQLDRPDRMIGPNQARKEASNLVDPGDPTRFADVAMLAAMTAAEIAELDISPTHPMWHTEAHRQAHPHGYDEILLWLDQAVSDELGLEYRFEEASKVLFLDEIKESATSPKVKVEDGYGQDLGLKWGEECATEPVVSRTFVKLGQKFCDLTDNRVGADSPLLVLPEGMTREQFTDQMQKSKYEFNLRPHIQSAAVVTAENMDRLLKDLPANGKYQKEQLIGRTVLTFRESLVEAKHDVLGRGGAVPLHSEAARSDRVRRGMQLVYMWLHLTDAKEDNHLYAFPKEFDGAKGRAAVAFMHDTGSGLGGIATAGLINKLHTDGRFLRKTLLSRDLVSLEFQLYRSSAWDKETMADLLWMAEKICSLSRDDIAECVGASEWPDFMKEALVYRLAARRDILAEHFDLTTPDRAPAPPTIEVPLTTRADRESAAARYGLDVETIDGAMKEAGLDGKPFTDVLLKTGTVSDAQDTVLIGLLRDRYYPTGLDHRTGRKKDGRPYRPIRYGD